MDGTFVKEIERLAKEAAGEGVLVETVEAEPHENLYSTVQLFNLPKDHAPDEPAVLKVHSLQGLVDYIAANRDELKGAECMIHVVSPTCVRIISKLQPRAKRFTYLEAEALDHVQGWTERWVPLEEAIIGLQSRFAEGGDRARVLRVLGNVTEKAEVNVLDDGISQQVTTRAGTTGMKEESPVPNPVMLRPYRTFSEVEQVESPYLLRMRSGAHEGRQSQVALFEADGGAWELEAVQVVASWLQGQVGDFAILH